MGATVRKEETIGAKPLPASIAQQSVPEDVEAKPDSAAQPREVTHPEHLDEEKLAAMAEEEALNSLSSNRKLKLV